MPTDWIPVNVGARSLVELITYPKDQQEGIHVYHQVNPHPAEPWTELMKYVTHNTGRAIKMIPLQEWWTNLQHLGETNDELRGEDPIYMLLPYLEKVANSPSNSMEIRLDTKITCERSPTLSKECPIIDESIISRYITYWKHVGFLKDSDLLTIRN
ncbi:hypothetical protein K7432_018159 [Basidiobolus ranarum]|uniref:Sulfotransferase n=1 Tax=Basidiobolus ranarum TaxID=34480 RepID=A0ABR2VJF5_9FUNG